jgi:hypothetical protein
MAQASQGFRALGSFAATAAVSLERLGFAMRESARSEYKAAGEPFGPTDFGFKRWYFKTHGIIPNFGYLAENGGKE